MRTQYKGATGISAGVIPCLRSFPITELSADAMSTAADVAAAAASRVPLPAVEVVQHCQLFPKSSCKSAEGSCTSCTVSGPAGVAHLGTEQAVVLAVLPWMPASVVKARMGAGGQRGLLLQLPPPLNVSPPLSTYLPPRASPAAL